MHLYHRGVASTHEKLKAFLREKEDIGILRGVQMFGIMPGYTSFGCFVHSKLWHKVIIPTLKRLGTIELLEHYGPERYPDRQGMEYFCIKVRYPE